MTEPRRTTAELVAYSWLNQAEAAERVGVARSTLWHWRKRPEFQARIREHLDVWSAKRRRERLADLRARLAEANRVADGCRKFRKFRR